MEVEEPDDGSFALPAAVIQQHQKIATAAEGGMILCCDCGVLIPVNPTALCVNCIRSKVDISEGIPKQVVVYYCRGCLRYLNPPNSWVTADLESRELLQLLLKKLKGLDKIKLIDAGFMWTEPHSKRIKVKLAIQSEVMNGAILQQEFVVEYVIHHQFCEDCHRQEAKDTWSCSVQLRQKVKHKKTFFYLEQLIIRHRAYRDCINIKSRPDGVDFYFANRSKGKKMIDFFTACAPIRSKTSERLVSQDIHTSTYNFKHSFSVELVPICKQDVVCLHPQLAKRQGCMRPLAICYHVGSVLKFIDPTSLQSCEINASKYWAAPFDAVCNHETLTEFTVLDAEIVYKDGRPVEFGKFKLVDLTLARCRDLGVNDEQCTVRSHLGNIVDAGDNCWAFDIATSNTNDEHFNKLDLRALPDAIVVKKSFSDRRRGRHRKWKLKEVVELPDEMTEKETERHETDKERFLRDVEEDPELRANIHIYKDASYDPGIESEVEDEDLKIDLDEMLEEFDALDLTHDAPHEDDEDPDGPNKRSRFVPQGTLGVHHSVSTSRRSDVR
jgi:nonsense-mediated mRNA decay protein 3